MDILLVFQDNLLKHINNEFIRPLYKEINWDQRMLAIKGSRGVGKTTLMLQHLKYARKEQRDISLYVSADFYWFYNNSLYETASTFYLNGGRYLYIDEVHKYPNWSRELKNIYDGFPDMKVVFSSSSALDVYRGEADLSRRVITYELPGLSFREYLEITGKGKFDAFILQEILTDHLKLSRNIREQIQPLPLFKQYLKTGYYPIINEVPSKEIPVRLGQTINTVLESDLAFIENYTPSTGFKVKKLLGAVAESAPFKPNIAALARKLDVSRDSIYAWLSHLQQARLLNLVQAAGKGTSLLQKPEKVYLENTNLSYALKPIPDEGAIRETFLLNHLMNSNYKINIPPKGDFLIDDKIVIEVGGKNKDSTQIKDLAHAYLAVDNIETGYGRKIPLWLFGFLY